jgi:hypothetical protein
LFVVSALPNEPRVCIALQICVFTFPVVSETTLVRRPTQSTYMLAPYAKNQSRLDVKSVTILRVFSSVRVLPHGLLMCSSVLLHKVRTVGTGDIDLEQQVKKRPQHPLMSFCCHSSKIISRYPIRGERDSAVGIATGYGLDDRGVGVRDPVAS